MSAQTLIDVLNKMLRLQKSLYEIAIRKTEVIKKGDVAALSGIMKDEQAHIAAIDVLEQQQQYAAASLTGSVNKRSISDCMEKAEGIERLQLEKLKMPLTDQLAELKNVNSLNQQLLEQSLQFVTLNLDLLMPAEEVPGYTKEMDDDDGLSARSLFDSKA